jgi:DNA polymerase-3 subunit delta
MLLKAGEAQRFLRKPDASIPAALFFGPDRARVEESAAILTAAVLGPDPEPLNLTRLGEDDVRRDKARLADEVAAQSLLGGARVVRVRCDGDAQAEAVVAIVTAIEAGAPMGAMLIVEGGDLKPASKIRKAFDEAKSCIAIAFYEESAEERRAFAAALLAAAGCEIEPDAREILLAGLPEDRGGVRAEIEKLALYAHGLGRAIDDADVRALSVAAGESELDDAAGHALDGEAAAAARALDRAGAGNGVTILKALERKLMRLAEAQALIGQGVPRSDVGGKLRPPVFWKEREAFAQRLSIWTAPRVQAGLARLWAAEVACKSAGAPSVLIAAQCFAEIARLVSSARR